jgi:hypothetical protein
MKLFMTIALVSGCAVEPLSLIGADDSAKSLVAEAVSNVNNAAECQLLSVSDEAKLVIYDSENTLSVFNNAPSQEAPLDIKVFLLLTPTRDRKLAVLYRQIGFELGLETTPDSVMQHSYSWEDSENMASSLVTLLKDKGLGCK